MAIEKNFVVKNGLEVNDNLLVANKDTGRVGVKTFTPAYDLEVIGGIGATDLLVGSAATVRNCFFVGTAQTASLKACINSSGVSSVGINTTDPAYPLHVVGPVGQGQTALFVHGDTFITGQLNVGAADTGTTDIIIEGDILVGGISTFNGHVDLNNTLNVVGFSTFNNVAINTSLHVAGITSLTNLYVSGVSTLAGFTTFGDSVYVNENFYVGGASTFVGVTSFINNVSVGGTLDVGGDLNITNKLTIGGTTNFIGTVTYEGEVVFDGGIVINGITTFNGITTYTDNVFVDGDVSITGNYYGDGSTLSGIVTQIVAGNGVTIAPSTGKGAVTVSIAASDFIANIALESDDMPLGAGFTTLNFVTQRTSPVGNGVSVGYELPNTSGVGTIYVTPGISLGLAIALS